MSGNRVLVSAGLLVALCVLGLYATVIYPNRTRQESKLEKEVREIEEASTMERLQLQLLRDALVRAMEPGLPVYSGSQKPWRDTAREIVAGLDRLVRNTGLNLLRLEPDSPEEKPPMIAHPYFIEVRGGFWEICSFMDGMERELLLVITSWSVGLEGKEGEGLRASFKVKANEWVGQRIKEVPVRGRSASLVAQVSRKDPFRRGSAPVMVARPGAEPLSLTGIISLGGGRRKAIIDGKSYSQGELVSGRRILSISEDEVLVEGMQPLRIQRPLRPLAPVTGGAIPKQPGT